MNEKEYCNVFRFSLHQGDVLMCEKNFNADQFNPMTRYSIDIRSILPKAITKLQKVLSKKNYDTFYDVGRENVNDPESSNYEYGLYDYYCETIKIYPQIHRDQLRYNPQPIIQQIEDRGELKTIRGVECKIGLYINDNPIVERVFYVDGFNPVARWSLDLTYAVVDIADAIYDRIKNSDLKNMWDDYDLINYRGLTIAQIRELPLFKREELLDKIRKN
jgi:hypothetical protein